MLRLTIEEEVPGRGEAIVPDELLVLVVADKEGHQVGGDSGVTVFLG